MDLQNPCGVFEPVLQPLSPRRSIDSETTVGLLANDKKNADVLLGYIQGHLESDHGIRSFRWLKKDATRPAELTAEFVADCHVVVSSVGD